ncbi:hypothetical protein FGE12_14570 [Aggregicoccus sp. 17bor-14]|uniref:hypothetical protein n=1 Tax=Myxococcaceae TaxID=31 RepID=UPI00129CF426|nr:MULTISPECIES: hypothetical protein [Myxococcaceae]MBF5043617.1 hypothetical protein [Simulacricoccus sp. 17bor-14]MRI89376.1 hypothetical protein [Aggregicoccus sp. 17bor-14]
MARSFIIRMFLVGTMLSGTALALAPAKAHAEPLYFALEVRRAGRLVAQPKLLGETGRTVRAERRQPGAAQPDYRLVLTPSAGGKESFQVELDVALPEGQQGHGELSLLHGEQRKLQLGRVPGELEVSLLVMKVDSPEFKALMDLGAKDAAAREACRSCNI